MTENKKECCCGEGKHEHHECCGGGKHEHHECCGEGKHEHDCCCGDHEHHDDDCCCEIDEIELLDEDGNQLTFRLHEWFDYKDEIYAVLIDEEGEAILLKSVEEDGEMSFITPSDEEFEEVSAYYQDLE